MKSGDPSSSPAEPTVSAQAKNFSDVTKAISMMNAIKAEYLKKLEEQRQKIEQEKQQELEKQRDLTPEELM